MIRELLKESFDLFVQKIWLKRIGRAVDRYNRTNKKAKLQAHIVHVLVGRYNEIYRHDPIRIKGGPPPEPSGEDIP